MKKISFIVPVDECETVKTSMFDAGAGCFEKYDRVSWQVLGQGQFRPLKGSNPSIGQIGHLEKLDEFRVEMFCAENYLDAAIEALRSSHPYESPVFEVTSVENSLSIR
jgi:hypothetical protein